MANEFIATKTGQDAAVTMKFNGLMKGVKTVQNEVDWSLQADALTQNIYDELCKQVGVYSACSTVFASKEIKALYNQNYNEKNSIEDKVAIAFNRQLDNKSIVPVNAGAVMNVGGSPKTNGDLMTPTRVNALANVVFTVFGESMYSKNRDCMFCIHPLWGDANFKKIDDAIKDGKINDQFINGYNLVNRASSFSSS